MSTTPNPAPRARLGYQNVALTAIALLLGIGLIDRGNAVTQPPSALAQEQEGGGLTNALEQRKIIIGELRAMNGRLDRIEARLASRLEVKVVDMPPLKLPPEARQKKDNPAPAPGEQQPKQ